MIFVYFVFAFVAAKLEFTSKGLSDMLTECGIDNSTNRDSVLSIGHHAMYTSESCSLDSYSSFHSKLEYISEFIYR